MSPPSVSPASTAGLTLGCHQCCDRKHACRDIPAILLAENGTPAEVAMSVLGHSSTAMTSYYTHIGARAKLPAVQALDAVMTVRRSKPQ